jgi:hypothetical protein
VEFRRENRTTRRRSQRAFVDGMGASKVEGKLENCRLAAIANLAIIAQG